jgi:5'-3' exonuclease
MPDQARPTLLLDSPSLIYRAFFALPTSLRSPAGLPVNAVRGYLDMVTRLITDQKPCRVIHAMDADWRPAWRVDAYAGYKANRQPDPPELPAQFDVILDVLAAAGMQVADAPGYEADDVIGTLTVDPDGPIGVVTGDRDLLQVVRDPDVWVLFPTKGVRELTRFDEAGVRAKYGIPPQRYADFATLRGDPSDGLPGVRGVGEKTAVKLVNDFPDLDALVAAANGQQMHSLPARVTAAVRDAQEYLAAMRTVVPVSTTAPVQATPATPPDPAKLEELGARYDIEGPVRRLQTALATLDQV